MRQYWRYAAGFWLFGLLALPGDVAAQQANETDLSAEEVRSIAVELFQQNPWIRNRAAERLAVRKNPDVVAALIQALRFSNGDPTIARTLQFITSENPGDNWTAWMLWQEAHPEIKPFAGFAGFKADLLANIDENFRLFLGPGVDHTIRLEEITWGGVVKDGIPALMNPKLVPADAATYLTDAELVFGVEINGDIRAYPLRILDWHEMFNDVVGGVPVALAYCTLCGSGILFDTKVVGRATPFVFGSSGFLYRSNKLMYDQETNSLWNQFTGKPVVGTLTKSDIQLNVRPVTITTWNAWRTRHPKTKVLSLDTGFERDYTPGRPYGAYFSSPDLMFPARVMDKRLKAKDYVFALRTATAEKAWPLSRFVGGKMIHDRLGDQDVLLIGDAATRTVRAYATGGRKFSPADGGSAIGASRLKGVDQAVWHITEDALKGPRGELLARLPGHIAFWFAWQNFRAGAPVAFK